MVRRCASLRARCATQVQALFNTGYFCPRGIPFVMPGGIKKASRLRLLGRLSPTCRRASFIFPCQAVTERRRQKGFATGRACTAIAFVFRKACSRACRSSFALACRPLSRYSVSSFGGRRTRRRYLSTARHFEFGPVRDDRRRARLQLAPWRPALEQQFGRQVAGVMMSKGSVDWSLGKKRGLGL